MERSTDVACARDCRLCDEQVRFARSQAGNELMVPLSWIEMQCPVTKSIEARKVAKPTST